MPKKRSKKVRQSTPALSPALLDPSLRRFAAIQEASEQEREATERYEAARVELSKLDALQPQYSAHLRVFRTAAKNLMVARGKLVAELNGVQSVE